MGDDCIFCKIISGQIKTEFIHKDDVCVAFNDIQPMAPTHVLVVPIEHVTGLTDPKAASESLLGHLMMVCNKIAKQKGVFGRGYRVFVNCGVEGAQLVPHLHFHVVGGRQLKHECG